MGTELQLANEATAPRSARRWLRQHLGDDAGDTAEIAELLLTEVVTNVVVHARTPSTVRLELATGRLCLEVRDASPVLPERRKRAGADDESGRGIELLDTLAERWGVRRLPMGKIVWFCLTNAPGPRQT